MAKKPQKQPIFGQISAAAFFAFAVFTLFLMVHPIPHFDLVMTSLIQTITPQSVDGFLSFFSLLGSFEICSLVLLTVLFVGKYRGKIWILGTFLVGTGIEVFGKTFLYHPGPPVGLSRYDLPFALPSSLVETAHSYPSGHSFRTTFIAMLLLIFFTQNKKISRNTRILAITLLAIFVALMLYSRVSLGDHWTTDVIGGTLLGICLCCGSYQFVESHVKK